MSDLATRVEQTVPIPSDLCAEVATVLGWKRRVDSMDDWWWWPPSSWPIRSPIMGSPPDFNSLDVVLRHTPEGYVWKLIQCEEDWWADLEQYLLQGRAYRCSGNAARLANAALAAIIREKVA